MATFVIIILAMIGGMIAAYAGLCVLVKSLWGNK